jgi:hypothetical protein
VWSDGVRAASGNQRVFSLGAQVVRCAYKEGHLSQQHSFQRAVCPEKVVHNRIVEPCQLPVSHHGGHSSINYRWPKTTASKPGKKKIEPNPEPQFPVLGTGSTDTGPTRLQPGVLRPCAVTRVVDVMEERSDGSGIRDLNIVSDRCLSHAGHEGPHMWLHDRCGARLGGNSDEACRREKGHADVWLGHVGLNYTWPARHVLDSVTIDTNGIVGAIAVSKKPNIVLNASFGGAATSAVDINDLERRLAAVEAWINQQKNQT